MKENRDYKKKLLSNTLIFGVGNFSSRILVFFLVPLYARALTTEEYGLVDLIAITINLIIPIFGVNIHEAILRFTLDKESNNKEVISIGIQAMIIGFFPVVLIVPIIMKFLGSKIYIMYFLVTYLITGLKNIFSYYARGTEKIKLVVSLGIVDTVLLLGLNLLFLLGLRQGIHGYYYSLIISGSIVIVIYIVKLGIRSSDIFCKGNKNLRKKMLSYSVPMIPNSLSWWVSNTSDKYILTYFWGVGVNGIYAIAYKIPSLLNTVTSIFMQAWQISAVEEYERQENDNFSHVYRSFFSINIIVCVSLIICCEFIGKIMFSREFYGAIRFVPILLVAYFFNGLASYLGSIYTASKKTNMLFISTCIGAIVNIVLNIILIPKYGGYGAAIATLVSYFIIWIVRLINTKDIISLKYSKKKTVIEIIFLMGIAICMSVPRSIASRTLAVIFLLSVVITNFKMIVSTYKVIWGKINKLSNFRRRK